jgi:hypothetical protein
MKVDWALRKGLLQHLQIRTDVDDLRVTIAVAILAGLRELTFPPNSTSLPLLPTTRSSPKPPLSQSPRTPLGTQ